MSVLSSWLIVIAVCIGMVIKGFLIFHFGDKLLNWLRRNLRLRS